MSNELKQLRTRVISAVVAVTAITVYGYFTDATRLAIIISFLLIAGMSEFLQIGFIPSQTLPKSLKVIYFYCAVLLHGVLTYGSSSTFIAIFGLVVVIHFSALLWLLRGTASPITIRELCFSSLVGFVYTAILPSYALKILFLQHGVKWFVLMLTVVFAGDTAAYFIGLKFGKKKLMAEISPKKTLAGSIGGLIGSLFGAGILGWWFFGSQSLVILVPVAALTGFFAQCGDLFESLLKRTCGVKNSGKIMPGHGGLLDRLDGVYFAAPIFYLLAKFVAYSP